MYSLNAETYLRAVTWKTPHSPAPKNCFITPARCYDGIGAQVHRRFSLMLFARHRNLTYFHSPFRRIEHERPENGIDPAETWENFFNLGSGEYSYESAEASRLRSVSVDSLHIDRVKWKGNVLYEIKHCHLFGDSFPHLYEHLSPVLQAKYNLTPKPPLAFFSSSKINVAIHIRRGDILAADGSVYQPERYTATPAVLATLKCVIKALDRLGLDRTIHLFSDGDPGGFDDAAELGATLHIKERTFQTFHHLVSADILIMAKSAFSYTAALLSNGIKLYDKFWHKPLPSWVLVDHQDLDTARSKVLRQIAQLKDSRWPLRAEDKSVTLC